MKLYGYSNLAANTKSSMKLKLKVIIIAIALIIAFGSIVQLLFNSLEDSEAHKIEQARHEVRMVATIDRKAEHEADGRIGIHGSLLFFSVQFSGRAMTPFSASM